MRAYEYSEPEKSLDFAQKILRHPLNQEPYYRARNYINLGKLFKNLGQFDSAVSNMLTGIQIAEKVADFKNMAMGYNSLGLIYKTNSDFEKALKYYRLSNIECTKLNYPNGMAMTLNNIGTILDAMNNTDSALVYYNNAAKIAEANDLIGAKAVSYNNIGEIYSKAGNDAEALPYYYKTLTCDSITNNMMGMCYTLYNISTSYKSLGKLDKAFEVLKTVEPITNRLNSPQMFILYERHVSNLHEEAGNYEEALQAHKRFHTLSDSVYNSEKSAQIAEMQTKYETEKKELEIQNLSQENEIKELAIQRKNGLILGGAAAVILMLLLIYLFVKQLRAKQKQKMIEAVLLERDKGIAAMFKGIEEERKRIAQDLHDGVGQQLSGLKLSLSHLQSKLFKKDTPENENFEILVKKLDTTCTEVREISHQMMPKALIENGVLSAIEDMLENTLVGTGISYNIEHYQLKERLPETIELTLFRICQELINNTIKHAKATEIIVQLIKSKKNIVLIVEDNGQGFDQNKSSDGIGLLNLTSRLNTINGEVSYESSSNSGTSATIRIPLV
ncbi:MAG: hypothetical protein CL842_02365 [Crocinitomicaceae bacterium]|nr:hypothetical protein [Crocinitomicaceae bacterium]